MSEQWLQQRLGQGEALRSEAERSGSSAAFAVWERFARQTARMQAIDEQLRRELPSHFSVLTGERLRYRGRDIYLEHLVFGPTGLYLIEVSEGGDPAWEKDLALNVAFFRESLGTNASVFNCLIVQRAFKDPVLPVGANLVPSVEVALDVIRDQSHGVILTPTLAREVHHLIQAVRITNQRPLPAQAFSPRPYWHDLFRLENLPVLVVLIASWMMSIVDPDRGAFVVGLIFFGLPAAVSLPFIRRNPNGAARAKRIYVLIAVQIALLWLLASAMSER